MTVTPRIFDRKLVRQRYERAVRRSAQASFLTEHVGGEMLERLSAVNRTFSHPLVQGDGRWNLSTEAAFGLGDRELMQLIPGSGGACPANGRTIVGDEETLPFGPHALDLFISVLSLQLVNDVPGALAQIRRALKPDGLFMAALPGGQTLNELRTAFSEAEIAIDGGLSPRVSPFADVRDLGALLQRAGFALPVADSEVLEVSYRTVFDLFTDLRNLGWTNALDDRRKVFLKKRLLMTMAEIYADKFSRNDGKITATFEIIYMTGWAPDASQQKPLRPGSASARLADALNSEETKIDDD